MSVIWILLFKFVHILHFCLPLTFTYKTYACKYLHLCPTLLNEIKKTKLQIYTQPQAGINILLCGCRFPFTIHGLPLNNEPLNWPRNTARGFVLRRTTLSSKMKELVGRVRGRTQKSTKHFIVPHVRKNFEIPNLAFRWSNRWRPNSARKIISRLRITLVYKP